MADHLEGTVLEGRYRVTEKLGEGGMGTVYRAQVQGGADVAVKVLHDQLVGDAAQRERFEREARALFGLSHDNILRVLDLGVVQGLPFLVMELLEGQNLEAFIESHRPDPATGMAIARQVLAGLAFAHGQGAVHRDIKAENVFLTRGPDGRPVAKLLDFGLVKFTDDKRWGSGNKLTQFGEVMGSPAYMSPEQATGAPVDARSDVYSMGVLLYELLTGAWPFVGNDRGDMMRLHLTAPVPSLSVARPELQFHPALEAVIQHAMAKDPASRYPNAAAMLAELDRIAQAAIPAPTQAPTPRPAGPTLPDAEITGEFKTGRRTWLLMAALLVLGLLGAIAAMGARIVLGH